MKIHQLNKLKPTASKHNPHGSKGSCPDSDLETVAKELLELARSRLPDGVMSGILQGYEDDVRQEGVLLALKWYIRSRAERSSHDAMDWNAARAVGAALRYCRLDAIENITRERNARRSLLAFQPQEVEDVMHSGEWSPAEIRQILEKAIRQALKEGLITHANASIAILVHLDQVPVHDLAAQLKRTRGAIYQHLERVKLAIPGIVRSMREDS